MKKWREAAAILLAAVLFIALTYGAAKLLLPVRTDFGATWDQYLQEECDSLDVLYFGSSIVYCDVIPAVVWKESRLTSYVMAGPEQTPAVTYHCLRQACKTQNPQAVVMELNGLFFPRYSDSAKPNLLYMPWGVDRVLATLPGSAPEDRLEMLFPLYGLHDRIYTVMQEEVEQRVGPRADDYAGYTLLTSASPLSALVDRAYDTGTDTYRDNIGYLRKISDFCTRKGIQLVLYLAPVYCEIPQDALDALSRDLEAIPHGHFFNCNGGDWPAPDPQTQWYDFLHLNLCGAEPFSRCLAEELQSLGLETEHSEYDALWQGRYDLIVDKLAEMGAAS